jgi:hypothetical protein
MSAQDGSDNQNRLSRSNVLLTSTALVAASALGSAAAVQTALAHAEPTVSGQAAEHSGDLGR